MKEILIEVDGKKIKAFVEDDVYKELTQPVKKTGYERATKEDTTYYFDNGGGYVGDSYDPYPETDGNNAYKAANYYTSKNVAENNVRADKLMRQLRRFAVEHREKDLDWENDCQNKYQILFDHDENRLCVESNQFMHYYSIYFDTRETAQLAIDTFKDELLWYFTEYKDSL